MNRRGKIVLAAAAVTVAGLATWGSATASAHGWGGNGEFATTLAQKLGVSEDKVKEALTSMQEEHRAERSVKLEERLTTLVSEGKITEAQKQLILAKHQELMTNRETQMEGIKNLTPEQRREKMQSQRGDLEKWAQDNGIDIQYLMPMGGRGHGKM